MASVKLTGIGKTYPDAEEKSKGKKTGTGVTAVRDFSLDIADREFIVLVGPSGCGKSTTLRMIAGLEDITEGELYIDGVLMNGVEPKDRDIAMVFQNYALYPHMSVYDNMAFSLKLRNAPKDEIDRKVREAAEILDISDLLDRKPKALSGGQRQRVAIGRAIVRSPKVLLMDEPLSNLDAKLRNQMRAEIIKLRDRIDATFIYVTHDQIEAMTLGDRIVVMKDGVIQQTGTPQEVFSRPANIFVAGFIGSPEMNFFEGSELRRDGDGYCVSLLGREISLTAEQSSVLLGKDAQGGKVTVGIRPVNLTLSDEGIPAVIDVTEMMGSEIHVHMDIGGKDAIAVVPTAGTCAEGIVKGKETCLSFNPSLMQIFDGENGKNIIYG